MCVIHSFGRSCSREEQISRAAFFLSAVVFRIFEVIPSGAAGCARFQRVISGSGRRVTGSVGRVGSVLVAQKEGKNSAENRL